MLTCLTNLASAKRFLVTFNGRAYDLNILSARFILNRSEDVLSLMPHIDLLHPSRRMFGSRLENARLVTIEANVLGVRREGDVPGYEIPQRYFDWLRRRDGRLLEDVFRHNRLDIVSIASLLKYLTDLVEGGSGITHAHHGDLLSAARLHHERGNLAAAMRMLVPLTGSHLAGVAKAARRSLSLIYKKTNQWDDAAELWEDMIGSDPLDVFAVEELAKFYEHHARKYEQALKIVHRVLDEARHLGETERRSLEHRMQRLWSKTASR
jgi:tetratricopeptide (TPR) repeat protein